MTQLVKNPLANAGDVALIPGVGKSPGEGNGNLLQYSCLNNSMDRGAWQDWSIVDLHCCANLWASHSKVTSFYMYIHSFFNILFHYGLSQEIGYSSLRCTVGPCCLSILNVIVYIYQLQIPSLLSLFPCSLLATTSLIFTSTPQSKFRIFLFSLKETPIPTGGDSPFHTPRPSPKLLLIYFLCQ